MVISAAFYLGSAVFGLYPLYASAVFSVIVAFGQSRKQQADFMSWLYKKFDSQNLKPKQLIYPSVNIFIALWLVLFHNVDAMM